jgi:hypothetical protein
MKVHTPEGDVPITVRFNQGAVDQIIAAVERGTYCALLGPRLCGKTVLLRYIENLLSDKLGWTCAYIDFRKVNAATQQVFFTELTEQIQRHYVRQTQQQLALPETELVTSAVFRAFLIDSLELLRRDLVLIIDNLDAIPTDLVQALLTSLRAAYMDQQTLDHRLTVVVSGALSLATLTVGESSPFRGIAERIFIGDLSREQSRDLIAEFMALKGTDYTPRAVENLLDATQGDAYLIRQLSQACIETAHDAASARMTARQVSSATRTFLNKDVYEYAPLLEAVRLIEEDPDLLRSILLLLENDSLPKGELPLPLSPDLDPLYLTGVIEHSPSSQYRIQNMIYRKFLAKHFRPGRVGHMLSMVGRWDDALDYLEAGVRNGDEQSRTDLLPATIQSIYASQDLNQAAHFLTRGLLAGFFVDEVQVRYALPGERRLRLIGNAGERADPSLWSQPDLSLADDLLEARAYRQRSVLRGGESANCIQRAIPLAVPGRNPIGVVTISNIIDLDGTRRQHELDRQLIGYLNQAARALAAVGTRRQELALAGRMQASLLPEVPPDLPGWGLTATWRPARETSGDFYDFIICPDGRLGLVLADVTDKGIGAALYMALSRTLLRTFAEEHPYAPGEVLRAVNQRILEDTHGGLFITMFYGLLNPDSGQLTYSNAGHHPPYLVQKTADHPPSALMRTGIPLGVDSQAAWGESSVQIDTGDLLLMYTDGMVDAHNAKGEPMGFKPMLEIASTLRHRTVRDVQDALISEVRAYAGSEQQFDDLTLVLLKRA